LAYLTTQLTPAIFIDSVVSRFTVVAQDHRRPCLPRCRCESLEHATTGDHVIAVTADFLVRDIYIVCLEHKGDMSSFHNFTGDAKETFELVL